LVRSAPSGMVPGGLPFLPPFYNAEGRLWKFFSNLFPACHRASFFPPSPSTDRRSGASFFGRVFGYGDFAFFSSLSINVTTFFPSSNSSFPSSRFPIPTARPVDLLTPHFLGESPCHAAFPYLSTIAILSFLRWSEWERRFLSPVFSRKFYSF